MKFKSVGLMLLAASALVSTAVAKKVAPVVKGTHFLAFDLDKGDFVPFDSDKSMKIFVMGPDGQVEPGVEVAESQDGTKVLVLPPEVASVFLGQPPADQKPKDAPQAESQQSPSHIPKAQEVYGQSLAMIGE